MRIVSKTCVRQLSLPAYATKHIIMYYMHACIGMMMMIGFAGDTLIDDKCEQHFEMSQQYQQTL